MTIPLTNTYRWLSTVKTKPFASRMNSVNKAAFTIRRMATGGTWIVRTQSGIGASMLSNGSTDRLSSVDTPVKSKMTHRPDIIGRILTARLAWNCGGSTGPSDRFCVHTVAESHEI